MGYIEVEVGKRFGIKPFPSFEGCISVMLSKFSPLTHFLHPLMG